MELPQIDDYHSILLNDTPLLDVRAPVEFDQGSFPAAENYPLINNEEREAIGIRYKNLGQDEAIKLGHELVRDEVKSQRVQHWQNFFEHHPQGVLYCFRGGMRSKISQQWIYEQTGTIYPRVKGGYKAMRRFLIDELEKSAQQLQPIMLGGRTGIGKTVLLQQLDQQIDLEGIYHHRGSVFGKHVTPQPSQIDIENRLSIELLKIRSKQYSQIVLEDEGTNIGSRAIPDVLFARMKQSPLILLQASIDERIEITFQEYIIESLAEHQQHNGDEAGFESWAEQLQTSIDKIQRRLGGVRHRELKTLLTDAIHVQKSSGNAEAHKDWIKILLVDYYDPMYDFQTEKKLDRVVFRGSQEEVLGYLSEQYNIS
ncbi:MAG: tRNA 2-selenouridine(34) synthase MnmH [Gammaproteobacteria bacterium]|nr:tRNA 2-selenouridine(34) synthase MnmH [Gammaproteobacteria bacterium]MBT8134309.1 tRNA 2-selenouridine(34) synthase MnmH [Gammaproteobacteria bacterium]NNJ50254.1 tRNA 2-selenouridine(34) synthase MnmH [Gammaproteobacteria bacterium]